jgi:holo-[acyl-carrier protein] synthase
MIFGIGVDVLKAKRMADMFRKFGERTAERLLMPAEMVQFRRSKRPERFLGLRFAAKEAIVKALGTGFAHGVWIRDVGIVANEWGRPEVVYSARGDALRRKLGVGDGHVTLTDEDGLIVAVAVLLQAPRKRAASKRAKTAKKKSVPAGVRRVAAKKKPSSRRTWGER